MTDGQNGRDGRDRPGLFRSWPEAIMSILFWLVMLCAFAPFAGLVSHVVFALFTWGWDLI